MQIYSILHEFSVNINFYETSLWKVIISEPVGSFITFPQRVFINVYIKMTTNIRFFLSGDFLVSMETPEYMLSTGFLHVTSWFILD